MLTIKEYIEINELETTKYVGPEEERERMTTDDFRYYYGKDYIEYVTACIHDSRMTNSKH